MNLLEEIVRVKKKTLAEIRRRIPLSKIRAKAAERPRRPSFRAAIDRPGRLAVIAEMKLKSPSAGILVSRYDPARIAKQYERSGARAVSVLTEESFFGGSLRDLDRAARSTRLPLLRKDFISDPYQIYEARAHGASCVLLIAAILSARRLAELLQTARRADLDALVEVHDDKELRSALAARADIVGINNRNLKDLSVSLATTFRLIRKVPKGICIISESGIREKEEIRALKKAGARAALIGEAILRDPSSLRALVRAGN